jgi:AraC-like DNA-binding protein
MLPWLLIFAIGAAQALPLAWALARRPGGAASRLLAAWMLLAALDLGVRSWALLEPAGESLRALRLVAQFPFLHASLFYLYVRCLTEGRGLRLADLRHALGFVAATLLVSEVLLAPPGSLPQSMAAWYAESRLARRLLLDLLLLGWGLAYVSAALWLLHRHRARLLSERSDSHPGVLGWLRLVAVCQALIWLIALAKGLPWLPNISVHLIYAAVAAWVLAVGWFSLIHPEAEAAAALPADAEAVSEDAGDTAEDSESAAESRGPGADSAADAEDDARADAVEARLRQLMQSEHLFLAPALTIGQLARRSGYPEYLVSQVINRRFGCPFWEYVNGLRVAAAQAALRDPEDARTALEIAYACGFTSKSTFNAAFKRLTGETPSACRQQAQDARAAAKAPSGPD